jgi:hypothetical protein
MDIEGAEKDILPALLSSNSSHLIDVLLWECHLKWKGAQGRCQCADWEMQLRARGVRFIYREPYRWAHVEKHRAAVWAAPTRRRDQ